MSLWEWEEVQEVSWGGVRVLFGPRGLWAEARRSPKVHSAPKEAGVELAAAIVRSGSGGRDCPDWTAEAPGISCN